MKKIKEFVSYENSKYLVISLPILVYFSYKLALEVWCVAYGLIY